MAISDEIKSSNFDNKRSMALVNVLYTANWFRDLYKVRLKRFDILPQHYNALRIIKGRYPQPISPGEIKEVMLDKGPDVTRLIDKLVGMNLVDRCPNETNRRVMEIRISELGISTLAEMTHEINIIIDQYLGLNEAEAQQLSDLLDKARIN